MELPRRLRRRNTTQVVLRSAIVVAVLGFLVIGFLKQYGPNNLTQAKDDDDSGSVEAEQTEITSTPLVTTTFQETEISNPNIQLFKDINNNGTQDSKEVSCDVCVLKVLIGGKTTGQLNSSLQVSVKADGKAQIDSIYNSYFIWGAYPDRELLIKPTQILPNDVIQRIPAYESEVFLSGVNSYIADTKVVSTSSSSRTVRYVLAKLVPPFMSIVDTDKELWFSVSPQGSATEYYLSSGKLKSDNDGKVTTYLSSYYIDVVWSNNIKLTDLTDPGKINLIKLK